MVGAGGLVGGEERREEGKKRWLTLGSAAAAGQARGVCQQERFRAIRACASERRSRCLLQPWLGGSWALNNAIVFSLHHSTRVVSQQSNYLPSQQQDSGEYHDTLSHPRQVQRPKSSLPSLAVTHLEYFGDS